MLTLILTPSIGNEWANNPTAINPKPNIILVVETIMLNDILKWLPGFGRLTITDTLNAHMLQKLPENAIVITHGGGDKRIHNANFINAIQNTTTPYYLLSVGSPISESDLRESTARVGAKFLAQINHPYDPILGIFNSGEDKVNVIKGYGKTYMEYFDKKFSIFTSILELIKSPFIVFKYQIEKYNSFKSYYNNPDFQIQQTIQNILQERGE